MSLFRKEDFASKREIIHKTKLPTHFKSKPQFCRNCNAKNKDSALVCIQCGITLKLPKLRKRMR